MSAVFNPSEPAFRDAADGTMLALLVAAIHVRNFLGCLAPDPTPNGGENVVCLSVACVSCNWCFLSRSCHDLHGRGMASYRLVPGDIVVLQQGKATCDMVLLQGNCLVDESILSGEVPCYVPWP